MSAGKPIITMINGETKELIDSIGCGIAIPAGDDETFAESVLQLANMSLSKRAEIGEKGRKFVDKHFNFATQMTLLEKIVNE